MRLLTEYMSVPEANGSVVANSTLIDRKSSLTNKEVDSVENRNLQLARLVEEHKAQLIDALSKFPVTALWVFSKYEQVSDKDEQEDETNVPSEFKDFLKDIKKHYQSVSQSASGKAKNEEVYANAKRRLMFAVRQFPFAFEDLVKLVDIVTYAFKFRGISFKPDHSQGKKQSGIILKRLQGVARRGSPSLAERFKAMDLHQHEKQFLFLSTSEMSKLLADVVLAEHYWLAYRQQLATVNSKLVLFIANQYKGNFLDFDDLVQEGHTGLLKAVDRFKYRLGFQFSTYAGYWIRQAISRSLSRSERVVRIPCGQIATINRLFRAKDEITLKTGKKPSIQELAEYTLLSQDEVNNILSISQPAVAWEIFDDDEDKQSFAPIDFLEQKVFIHPYSRIADAQLQGLVNTAIKTLNPREAKIICSHFGVGTDQQMTLQEIGAELNLTRERVRQIQVVALNKIKMRYGEQLLSFL
ncbi:RNA polymerase sigma factor RpoD/SigA [Methyloglobulus sp.]|uniref:sigma-70 family RNA polymerase sigma factor n=1 Tax=Methyloglobulus sp. TaxID=2518622 RepID=UPI0039894E8C